MPGWAEVRVDGESTNRNMTGSFSMRLTGGKHRFQVVNADAGVDVVLRYEVKAGDSNNILLLDYERGSVRPRP